AAANVGGPDHIEFNIDLSYQNGGGGFTIAPLSALPAITDAAVIDGYTQPGANPNTQAIGDNAILKIVLDGSLVGAGNGFDIRAGNSTVRGFAINGFSNGNGIVLAGGGNDFVVGNFIGTDATGELFAANNGGIYSSSPGN